MEEGTVDRVLLGLSGVGRPGAELLAECTEEEKDKIADGNIVRIYGFND